MNPGLWLQCKGDCVWYLEWHRWQKMPLHKWYKLFDQASCICKRKSLGRWPVTEAKMDEVWIVFICSPRKSIRLATRQLNMPHKTVYSIPWKRLKFTRYKYQLLLHVTAQEELHYTFCCDFFQDLKMINSAQPKLSSMMKPYYIQYSHWIWYTHEISKASWNVFT